MTKIKLCGLTRPQDIEAANACGPDYIGFVFARKSRRYVAPEQAARLRDGLLPGIAAVGVFVDADIREVAELLERGIIDLAQLHGREDEAYIARLKALTPKPVIKAFGIDGPSDIARAARCGADFVLLDNGSGGTGERFDWALARELARPYFLAGGLNPERVGAAVSALHPYAVDVSSGIESGGVKDREKMAAFVAAVRAQERRP